jgi:hypothetical protein
MSETKFAFFSCVSWVAGPAKSIRASFCVIAWILLVGCPAQAGKTAVINCTKATDGTILHEKEDVEDSARQFAIYNPQFYRINQFRKGHEVDAQGNQKGTCIIDFMSEAEFNFYIQK